MSETAAGPPAGTWTGGGPGPSAFAVGIGSISDVVFGLALSIGSLILVDKTPQTGYALVRGIYYFGFSFLIVVLVWLSFRRIVVVLPYETQTTLVVNVALLFCVAIEPFLFYVLVTTSTVGNDASTAFAIDIGVMLFLLSVLDYLLLNEERSRSLRKLPPEVVARQERSISHHLAAGSMYLVSALPLFWSITIAGGAVRYDLWYFALIWAFAVRVRWATAARPKPTADRSDASAASLRGGRPEAR